MLSWVNGGITYQGTWGGKNEGDFHSGYVESQVALRYPAGLWDWSSEEDIGSHRHIIYSPPEQVKIEWIKNTESGEKKKYRQRLRDPHMYVSDREELAKLNQSEWESEF